MDKVLEVTVAIGVPLKLAKLLEERMLLDESQQPVFALVTFQILTLMWASMRFDGEDGQAGELSIDTSRPEDPQVYCASMHAMEACSPAGVVIHIVAPGGERMRCNRLPLESCMILGRSSQDVGRLCVRCKTMR